MTVKKFKKRKDENKMLKIIRAEKAGHYAQTRTLFAEYAASLDFKLDFQNFNEELVSLPGAYAPPEGCILLAEHSGQFAGCVALRKIDTKICEMKRLYVIPEFRGKNLGRTLAREVINEARELGYKRMRLDTVASMATANALYVSLGFRPIAAYCYNPLDQANYYELSL
jgi:ribosomal protein S18 acetylase RimI-like enzyme